MKELDLTTLPKWLENANPNPYAKPLAWERTMEKVIFSISEKVPVREDVKRVRQIIDVLPRRIRRALSPDLVFGLLPVIVIGFKAHTENRFQSDSNQVKDVAGFIESSWQQDKVIFASYLCAHRGHGTGLKKHVLVESIPIDRRENALRLLLALGNRINSQSIEIRVQQQLATSKISSNMFPQMYFEYANSGRIEELFGLVDNHSREMQESILRLPKAKGVNFYFEGIDEHTNGVSMMLEERYGKAWKSLTSSPDMNDGLLSIATEYGLPYVERIVSLALSSDGREYTLNNGRKNTVTGAQLESLDWFFEQSRMTSFARALYETCFYYRLGNRLGYLNAHYVGLERDHTQMQDSALRLGVLDTGVDPRRFLFARRAKDGIVDQGKGLNKISFRQFWR